MFIFKLMNIIQFFEYKFKTENKILNLDDIKNFKIIYKRHKKKSKRKRM